MHGLFDDLLFKNFNSEQIQFDFRMNQSDILKD